jgi:hypothetical protein
MSKGPLSRDRGPAQRYLALLRDRCPFAYGPDETPPVTAPPLERTAASDDSPGTAIELRDAPVPSTDGEFGPKPPAPKEFDLPGS